MKQVQWLRSRYLYLYGGDDDDDDGYYYYIVYIYIYINEIFIYRIIWLFCGVHICVPLYSTPSCFHDSSSPCLGVTEHCFGDDERMNSSYETVQNRYCFDNRFRIIFSVSCIQRTAICQARILAAATVASLFGPESPATVHVRLSELELGLGLKVGN